MQVTIKDIARAAAVSVQTVSNVVNGRPVVREATRARVLAICRELNYTPNAAARSLVTGSRTMIGAVVPHIGNPLYGEVTTFLTRAASERGFSTLVGDTGWEPEAEMTLLRGLIGQGVDGVILASTAVDGAGLRMVQDAGIPVVMLFNYHVPCPADSFRLDNAGAFRVVTRHLIGLGHRRIAFARGLARSVSTAREDGWRSELERHGLPAGDDLVAVSGFGQDGGYAAGTSLLSRADRPTAIVCSSDIIACGVLDAAEDLGRRVPHDVAVTGCDDMFVAGMRRIRLTTLRYDHRALVRQALDRLMDRIAGRVDAAAEPITMSTPCDLVIRDSCGMNLGPRAAASTVIRSATP
jgi:DNA-binding LacI/PurR family transcriptional regulator